MERISRDVTRYFRIGAVFVCVAFLSMTKCAAEEGKPVAFEKGKLEGLWAWERDVANRFQFSFNGKDVELKLVVGGDGIVIGRVAVECDHAGFCQVEAYLDGQRYMSFQVYEDPALHFVLTEGFNVAGFEFAEGERFSKL